jgi:hypothetical protein
MARKAEKQEKPKRVYRKKTEAKAPLKREPKTPYNWRKHVKSTVVEPQNTPEYLRAEAAVEKDLIFDEVDLWISRFPQALSQLQSEAGGISSEDVMYHLNLISRILRNKYAEKSVIM